MTYAMTRTKQAVISCLSRLQMVKFTAYIIEQI